VAVAATTIIHHVSAAFITGSGAMLVGEMDDATHQLGKRALEGGYNGWGTFDQLIDHSDASLGTFKQRYWYGTEFWKGPGSPIIVTTPGEQSAARFNTTYTTEQRITGLMAKELGAAVLILEHRYYGESSPFDTLTVENLQYLTLNDSIHDLTYFANNFKLPFDSTNKSTPAKAPWIFEGCSYPGALAAWMEHLDPGTYWAYHGSSAVVQTIGDFWTYFNPVLEATPQNCTNDLDAAINYMDKLLLNGTHEQKVALKTKFMLQDLTDADFVS